MKNISKTKPKKLDLIFFIYIILICIYKKYVCELNKVETCFKKYLQLFLLKKYQHMFIFWLQITQAL
jgi:hypothetical protein